MRGTARAWQGAGGSAGVAPRRAVAENPLLALQRSAGNAAVVALVQRQQAPKSCRFAEPNGGAVERIVNRHLSRGRRGHYDADELQTAWFRVRNQRELVKNCCNPELVAAEHYLYARYAVANGDYSPFEMKMMVWAYGYVKFLVPRTGNCPKSPDTQGSRDWGYKGADDGADDLFYQNLN